MAFNRRQRSSIAPDAGRTGVYRLSAILLARLRASPRGRRTAAVAAATGHLRVQPWIRPTHERDDDIPGG